MEYHRSKTPNMLLKEFAGSYSKTVDLIAHGADSSELSKLPSETKVGRLHIRCASLYLCDCMHHALELRGHWLVRHCLRSPSIQGQGLT
jgi:hypothetical protein